MRKGKTRPQVKIDSGSMADIAFLLLIFFLVATTIQMHQGLSLKLPPDEPPVEKPIHERNLFKVLVNSDNEILVEGEKFISYEKLKKDAKAFVMNNGANPMLSDNPEKAIVSLKVNHGTKYDAFIQTLDALQGAYYEIYGGRIGISADDFRNLDLSVPGEREKYLKARAGIPMNISIAEPTKTENYGAF